MKLKHLFIINAIIALGYALGELFVPETLGSIYGFEDTANPELMLTARYFGWGLLAVGLICALAANTPPSEAKQAIVKALFIAQIVGVAVSLMGTINGVFNAMGWSAVIIYLFLAAGYGYFWFIKPETA
ncbi:MAG: hypothetical protein KAS40_00170 [Desulfobacterales bacterium]|nr:hypothetical protein [Desulfobacterales bacterium]